MNPEQTPSPKAPKQANRLMQDCAPDSAEPGLIGRFMDIVESVRKQHPFGTGERETKDA